MQDSVGCAWLDNHVYIDNLGRCLPCCVYQDDIDPISAKMDPTAYQHTSQIAQLRQDLRAGIQRPGCSKCWAREATGTNSLRHHGNQKFTQTQIGLRSLEIGVGRTCTLKCRTCAADCSTAWQSENLQRGKVQDWSNDSDEILISVFDDIQHIKITGGEPFIIKAFARLVDRLVQSGHAAHISLEIYTNLESWPNQTLRDDLRQFRHLDMHYSIDAVGPRNEYIRSGSSWTATLSNLRRWGEFDQCYPALSMSHHVSHTVSTFNMIYLDEMLTAVQAWRAWPGLADLSLWPHPASGTNLSVVRRLPAEIKQRMLDHLSSSFHIKDELSWFRLEVRSMLLSPSSHGIEDLRDWLQEQQILDQLRGQSLQVALPELSAMLYPSAGFQL
jgi:hypothetical protein